MLVKRKSGGGESGKKGEGGHAVRFSRGWLRGGDKEGLGVGGGGGGGVRIRVR